MEIPKNYKDTWAKGSEMLISIALNGFIEDYIWQHGYGEKTANNYRWSLNSFIKANEDLPIAQITQEHVKSWRRYMDRNQYAVGAVNAYLYRFRKLLTYYSKQTDLMIDPTEIIIPKKNKPIPKFLSIEEVNALINACDSRGKAVVSLLYASGIRVGELVQLRKNDIYGETMKIRGKGGIERIAFVDERARQYIQEYLQSRTDKCPYLFYSRKRQCDNLGLGVAQIQSDIRKTARLAGIEKTVTPHVLRHSFATHMIQTGCGAFHLQRRLGHADISTTQISVHLGSADLKSAYKQFHTA